MRKMRKMRKTKQLLMIFMVGLGLCTFTSSCKTGEGCETASYSAQPDKNGILPTKRGKSNLYSKKQRKKMKRN